MREAMRGWLALAPPQRNEEPLRLWSVGLRVKGIFAARVLARGIVSCGVVFFGFVSVGPRAVRGSLRKLIIPWGDTTEEDPSRSFGFQAARDGEILESLTVWFDDLLALQL